MGERLPTLTHHSLLTMRPKISFREKAVALTGALTLAYTAWGFGGVLAWSMHIMLAGGLVTLALALQPFGGSPKSRPPWRRFIRLPGTYLAIVFLLFLLAGALNPNYEYVREGDQWWIQPIDTHFPQWWPTSIRSTYEPMNAWRIINIHIAAFSLALGLYCGLSRRSTICFVLWTCLLNITAMAVVAIIQHTAGAETVLMSYTSENEYPWGSFFYRNQGAAYLNWGIVLAAALFFYHANRTKREGHSGGPHFLAICFIGVIVTSVGLALSRGGILFAGLITCCFIALAILGYLRNAFQMPLKNFAALSILFIGLLTAIGYQAYQTIDWDAMEARFGNIEDTIKNADKDQRYLATKATWAMAQDEIWTGWGAGSFRYGFPIYQMQVPEIFHSHYHPTKGWIGLQYWRYAHNDVVQFIAEYGAIGASILLLFILTFLVPPLFASFSLTSIFLWIGFIASLGHAFIEFIFHSPSYWVAFITGIALLSRLIRLDAREG